MVTPSAPATRTGLCPHDGVLHARRCKWRRTGSLTVYELLPRTNCGACGEATCMAFAFGLLEQRLALESCPALANPTFGVQKQTLLDLLPSEGNDSAAPLNLNAL